MYYWFGLGFPVQSQSTVKILVFLYVAVSLDMTYFTTRKHEAPIGDVALYGFLDHLKKNYCYQKLVYLSNF